MNDFEKMKLFEHYFKRPIMLDPLISALTGKLQLDIIKMDTWLHDYEGYTEEEHGSMADFITLKYGEKATQFIRQEFLVNDQKENRSK